MRPFELFKRRACCSALFMPDSFFLKVVRMLSRMGKRLSCSTSDTFPHMFRYMIDCILFHVCCLHVIEMDAVTCLPLVH